MRKRCLPNLRRPFLASSSRPALSIAGALLLAPAILHGQEAARWLPGIHPFEPLIAAPRETQFRGSWHAPSDQACTCTGAATSTST